MAITELDSDAWVAEVKRLRGKQHPLTAAGLQALRAEQTRTLEPAQAALLENICAGPTFTAEELKAAGAFEICEQSNPKVGKPGEPDLFNR